MRTADSDYILALHNGAPVVNYATFILYDGTRVPLEPQDFRLSGNTFTDKTTDGNSFSVGSFIGKTANICIDNSTGKFDGYDFYMSRFILNEAVPVGNNVVKQVSIGNFTVVTDYTPGSIINFSGVDDSYLFDKPHNLTGVKTLKQIIQAACSECLGSQTFDGTGNFDLHSTQINTDKLDGKLTWRQIVSYIAMMTGYNAYIDVDEILRFKWYDYSVFNEGTAGEDYHLIDSYKSFQLGTYDISITGVRVVNGDTVVEKPSIYTYNYSYVIEVKDNPLCEGIENTIANHLGTKLNDLTFRIFNCDVLCNPLIEAGDMALVVDTKDISHRTIINDVSFQTNGYTKIACKAENIIRQQAAYSSPIAKAIVEANRNTARQLSAYDESVQRMNRLAQNANGLYTGRVEKADGSVVYYESDHEITYWPDGSAKFVNHSHVWKNTNMGHFYSTDSGTSDLGEYPGSTATTWIGGVDRDGNAVMNTVAAIGLLADWIVAGELTVGGSKTNPQNAVITVKDANDNTIVTINKNGIIMNSGYIASSNYAEQTPEGTFSLIGMKIDVNGSYVKSPHFAFNNSGAYIDGEVIANSGRIGAATITQDAIKIIGDVELYNGSSSFTFKPADYYFLENFKLLFKTSSGTSTVTLVRHQNGTDTTIGTYTATTEGVESAYIDRTLGGDNYYRITVTASTEVIAHDVVIAYMGMEGFRGVLQGIFKGYLESNSGIINGLRYNGSGDFYGDDLRLINDTNEIHLEGGTSSTEPTITRTHGGNTEEVAWGNKQSVIQADLLPPSSSGTDGDLVISGTGSGRDLYRYETNQWVKVGAMPNITITNTDPGEGVALADNNFILVYE